MLLFSRVGLALKQHLVLIVVLLYLVDLFSL